MQRRGAGRSHPSAIARPGLLVALLLVPVCVMVLKPVSKTSPVGISVDTTAAPGTSTQFSLRAAINNVAAFEAFLTRVCRKWGKPWSRRTFTEDGGRD